MQFLWAWLVPTDMVRLLDDASVENVRLVCPGLQGALGAELDAERQIRELPRVCGCVEGRRPQERRATTVGMRLLLERSWMGRTIRYGGHEEFLMTSAIFQLE